MPEASAARVGQLAQSRFFAEQGYATPFIFAIVPAGIGAAHRVAVDLEKNVLFCDCPFFPKPCLHALALRQLYQQTDGAGFAQVDTLPDEFLELISGSGGRLRRPAADTGIARQQRRNDRLERAAAGFADLETWLLDTVRRGLATTVSEDPHWAGNIAARMADASLTGLSRTLRLLGGIPPAQPDWAEKTLAGLAEMYLALRTFQKREHVPEPLLADLQNWIGLPTKKEDVLAQGERLTDTWMVLGEVEAAVEDKLKVRRTWLSGTESRRTALLLDYAFGSAPFAPAFPTGTAQHGTVAWYPSAWPLRALALEDFQPAAKLDFSGGYPDFQSFADAYAEALGAQPWLGLFPGSLLEVTVFFNHEQLYVLDRAGKVLPVAATENLLWRLLAITAGRPVRLFGEWDGAVFLPLTVVVDGRIMELQKKNG